MSEGRRGLGRGLSALLGEVDSERRRPGARRYRRRFARERRSNWSAATPDQPRRPFREADLVELSDSIREKGVLQPILVRPAPAPPASTRSSPASAAGGPLSSAGLQTIPVMVRELDDLAGAGNRHHRERPARRPQRHRRGAELQGADREVPADPGSDRPDRGQEPQPRGQHPAPAGPAGLGPALRDVGRADGRPRPRHRHRAATRPPWPARSSTRVCPSATPKPWPAARRRRRRSPRQVEPAVVPPGLRTPTPRPWKPTCRRCWVSTLRSTIAAGPAPDHPLRDARAVGRPLQPSHARPLRAVAEGLLSRTEEGSTVSVVELFARIEAHGRPTPG